MLPTFRKRYFAAGRDGMSNHNFIQGYMMYHILRQTRMRVKYLNAIIKLLWTHVPYFSFIHLGICSGMTSRLNRFQSFV